jgi:hypothetical protein
MKVEADENHDIRYSNLPMQGDKEGEGERGRRGGARDRGGGLSGTRAARACLADACSHVLLFP